MGKNGSVSAMKSNSDFIPELIYIVPEFFALIDYFLKIWVISNFQIVPHLITHNAISQSFKNSLSLMVIYIFAGRHEQVDASQSQFILV